MCQFESNRERGDPEEVVTELNRVINMDASTQQFVRESWQSSDVAKPRVVIELIKTTSCQRTCPMGLIGIRLDEDWRRDCKSLRSAFDLSYIGVLVDCAQ